MPIDRILAFPSRRCPANGKMFSCAGDVIAAVSFNFRIATIPPSHEGKFFPTVADNKIATRTVAGWRGAADHSATRPVKTRGSAL